MKIIKRQSKYPICSPHIKVYPVNSLRASFSQKVINKHNRDGKNMSKVFGLQMKKKHSSVSHETRKIISIFFEKK